MAGSEEVVRRFNDAFGRRDLDAVMALSTVDTVLETTLPKPDGERLVGQVAVRRYWEAFFRGTVDGRFETEELFEAGDRCVVRWAFSWAEADGRRGHVRGIDVFRVRDGQVAEKLVYVKG
jgi:ketosteroid isomerase-like protein